MPDYAKYLNPDVLAKISRLELRAKMVVEGFISGMHRSPYHGYSVEFAAHREYVPGDDIRHIDWRLFARGDRLYIKQYEEETNLRAHILLDCSKSMGYPEHAIPPSTPLTRGRKTRRGKTSGGKNESLSWGGTDQLPPLTRGGSGGAHMSKFDYACTVAASLVYLLLNQQDSCGLVLFDHAIRDQVPPASSPAQLSSIMELIERQKPDHTTDIKMLPARLADQPRQRGLIVLISDLLADPDEIVSGLQRLRHGRQDLIVLQVLDHDELTFPFERNTLFEGLEDPETQLLTDPQSLRAAYLRVVGDFVSRIRESCVNNRIDYRLLSTRDPLDGALTAFLAARMHQTRR
ncbi:MAG: DUF58 domain-containing protein [Phycisphaerae bacterium]